MAGQGEAGPGKAGVVQLLETEICMTPEQARDIYYEALGKEYQKQQENWKKPIVQHEAEMAAWRVVISHIEGALTLELMDTGAFSGPNGKH